MVEFLISKGADVNAVADFELPRYVCVPVDYASWGLTPLHMAASEGSLEIARLLVDGGASIDLKIRGVEEHMEPQGLTAFELAVRSRRESDQRYEALLRLVAPRSPEQIEKYKNGLEERFRKIAAMGVNIGDYPKVAWKQEPLEELRRKEVEEPYAMLLKLVEAEVQRT
jgi:ankyrin repeat protein